MEDNNELVITDDTMIYRQPTADSDEHSVQDIWGQKLETRVVSAADVPSLIAEGWVTHPAELGESPNKAPTPKTGDELAATRVALETAEKLADEQAKRIAKLEADLKEANEARDTLVADLKAAEDLADAETKAKDAALAQLKAKPAKG